MGVESVTGIWDLNELWPLSSDDRTTADDHFRLIKSALLDTFPNVSGTIGVTDTEINHLSGISRNIETAIDALSASVQANEAAIQVVGTQTDELSAAVTNLSATVAVIAENVGGRYGGYINNGSTGTPWPSGWTVTKSATGIYRIVHGLGVGVSSGVIQLTPVGLLVPYLSNFSANGFQVSLHSIASSTLADGTVYFTLTT